MLTLGCTGGSPCASGFCIDGVCCTTRCGGGALDDCEACSVTGGGTTDGTCTALSAAIAPTVICGSCPRARPPRSGRCAPVPHRPGCLCRYHPYLLMMTIPVAYHTRRSPGGVVLQGPTRPAPAHSRALEPGASPAAGSCYAPSMQCYRAMKEAPDGLPVVEQSSRGLGVRVGVDLAPDESGAVHPGGGGMSVSPSSLWNVPPHRRPRRLGRGSTGKDADRVFWADSHVFPRHALVVRPDPNRPEQHAFVEPARTMVFEAYQEKLVATRSDWRDGEP